MPRREWECYPAARTTVQLAAQRHGAFESLMRFDHMACACEDIETCERGLLV
jgi:hypothetical protein